MDKSPPDSNTARPVAGGVAIPLILDKLRIDPAVGSGVVVTTITDVVGFFAFLGIATLRFGFR
jgi:magnesium transporter